MLELSPSDPIVKTYLKDLHDLKQHAVTLEGRDGIVCFVSNNSFVDQVAFDGMRRHLMEDFDRIDHIDLHGNVRKNPTLSGTTHNVFGIQVGVGITLAIKNKGIEPRIRYHRVPEMWRKSEKLRFLEPQNIPWRTLRPDSKYAWLATDHGDEWESFQPLAELFGLHSNGVKTNRDAVVYDWDAERLAVRVKQFVNDYNAEAHRHKSNKDADWPNHVAWSETLKKAALRGQLVKFVNDKIIRALYRPFAKRWLYFDQVLNERTYQWRNITGDVICITDLASEKPFMALQSNLTADLHLVTAGSNCQCFPLSHLKDSALTQFRTHYSNPSITKEEIFHYIYALLHHPEYRTRYAANLKRELPRIPFAPDFQSFAAAGKELARLHVEYESLPPWPLTEIENKEVPFTQRVTKMKLSKDKQSLYVNESLTLSNIPPETFDYRLGSRSALDWIIDQYQVKGGSDPNREDDPAYIIRLIGQVVRVSLETAAIVKTLPPFLP